VTQFTARAGKMLYGPLIALEHCARARLFGQDVAEDTMLPWDSYRDVLSEHARDHHFVPSAWIVVAALAVLLVVFA
jgi:hypothetical protein